jgi:simple sugar transport system permease protein
VKNPTPGPERNWVREAALPFLAVFMALTVGGILIWVSGADVRAAYIGLFEGMLGSPKAVVETLVAATPYIFLGLSVALGFKGGLFNIGAEGQFFMGALGASVVGFGIPHLPAVIHLPLALAAAALAGGLWGAIPGWLKARLGAHEVINTIMLNYIAVNLVDYLVKKVFRDPAASLDRTPFVAVGARLPTLLGPEYRLHAGFLAALLAVFLIHRLLGRTTMGFEIRAVGQNPSGARASGIQPGATMVLVMTLAGGLAGLAGAGEVLGLKHNLPAVFSSGYGFDSIAVALLAKSNPLAVIPAALLWGGLRNGAGLMQVRSGISIDLINVIQALVIVFVAADPVVQWLSRRRSRTRKGMASRKGAEAE